MLRRFATSEMKNKKKGKRCLGIKDIATKVGKGLVKYVKLMIDDKVS